jgi:hypothetical protein
MPSVAALIAAHLDGWLLPGINATDLKFRNEST